MRQRILRAIIEIFVCVAVVSLAWAATRAMYHFYPPLAEHGHFAFFLAAIALVAWRGGLFPAMFTVALSMLAVAWMLPPTHSLRVATPEDWIRLSLFTGLGLLISYLHHARHRAEEMLEESRSRLRFALDCSGVACWDVNVKAGTFWNSDNLPVVYGRRQSDFATTYEGFFAYIHPEDREFFHLASVGETGNERDFGIAHRIVLPDGNSRRLKTRGRMYVDETGRVERMVGAVYRIDAKPGAKAHQPEMDDEVAAQGV
jgi:PAS domain-containing protein